MAGERTRCSSHPRPHLLDALLVLGRGLGAAVERRDGGEEPLLEPHRLLGVLLPFIPREERREEGEGRHARPPPAGLAPRRRRGERDARPSPPPGAPRRRGNVGAGGDAGAAGDSWRRERCAGRARKGERERGGRHGTARRRVGFLRAICGGSRGGATAISRRRRRAFFEWWIERAARGVGLSSSPPWPRPGRGACRGGAQGGVVRPGVLNLTVRIIFNVKENNSVINWPAIPE